MNNSIDFENFGAQRSWFSKPPKERAKNEGKADENNDVENAFGKLETQHGKQELGPRGIEPLIYTMSR